MPRHVDPSAPASAITPARPAARACPALSLALALLLLAPACAQRPQEPLDDEAMVRARREGKVPEVAAREWFYPRYIHDYFPGMDQIAVLPQAVSAAGVDPLQAPVYQLLDKGTPSAVLVEPRLTRNEIFGRNAWMIWCAGNEGFWDWLGTQFGFVDLLRLLDTRHRSTRFRDAGLINEPGMQQAGSPSEDEFGLWLDQPADPAVREWRRAYARTAFRTGGGGAAQGSYGAQGPAQPDMTPRPGSGAGEGYAGQAGYGAGGAYDPRIPPPEIYGLSSGVVGLRLFPNPKFDAAARRKWDAARYYGSATGDPTLVRPYRVGMSCAFCHASFHPLKPPRDVTTPEWENVSGNIGAQYLRIRAVFGNLLPKNNFVYHLLDSQPPGTIDTSLIASDNINNPNTMNAVFKLAQRALVSFRNPKEDQSAVSAALPSIWRHPEANPPAGAPDPTPDAWRAVFASEGLTDELHGSNGDPRRVPRILVDGADSIGAFGALARVYLNIGTHYEHWNQLHLPVVGFRPQQPFRVNNVEKHSVYWHATQFRVGPLRDYFLKVTPSMPLVDARSASRPDATDAAAAQREADERRSRIDASKLPRGRQVFARNCIVCHSSIQPPERHAAMAAVAARGELWDHDPGSWLSKPSYVEWALKEVETEKFWRDNYLSTDYRIAVNLVETNACRALATNAITGNMWQDFSSEGYRRMPSVGSIRFFNPFLGPNGGEAWFEPRHKTAPGVPAGGGGPGFYRVPTLVSIWATAPFLHNNSLGLFTNDPSVEGRLTAFNDGIRKLLYPERRLAGSSYNGATMARLERDHGLIWRTTEPSYLHVASAYIPGIIGFQSPIIRKLEAWFPWAKSVPPRWWPLPSAALLLLAFFVLLYASRLRFRLIGYTAILFALVVGVVVYFLNGGLGDIRLGPIPAGTPVNLLGNLNPDAPHDELKKALKTTRSALTEIESAKLAPEAAWALLRERVAPELVKVSKCPDFVMDRGHYYEWFKTMSDADKEALIELLKTF